MARRNSETTQVIEENTTKKHVPKAPKKPDVWLNTDEFGDLLRVDKVALSRMKKRPGWRSEWQRPIAGASDKRMVEWNATKMLDWMRKFEKPARGRTHTWMPRLLSGEIAV